MIQEDRQGLDQTLTAYDDVDKGVMLHSIDNTGPVAVLDVWDNVFDRQTAFRNHNEHIARCRILDPWLFLCLALIT